MTMRDRLIDLLRKESCCIDADCRSCLTGQHCYPVTVADYLLANGVIVPPCEVGDTVWMVKHRYWCSLRVTGVSIGTSTDGVQQIKIVCGLIEFPMRDFGKTVFLTREEAEAALKKTEEKHD